MKAQAKVNFDKKAALARLHAKTNGGLTILGQQALKDTSRHVPKDQGSLQSSGISHSDFAAHDLEYILRWDEPYSQYLFHGKVMHGNPTERTYGPEKLKFTETLARMEWTKYAEKVYGKEWQKVLQEAVKGE